MEEDEDEVMTTTRRRRLVKKVLKQDSDQEEAVLDKPVENQVNERVTGGRRLRRVSTKKQPAAAAVVLSSDDEAIIGAEDKEDDEDNFTPGNNKASSSRKKTAKKSHTKKSKKLTTGAKTAQKAQAAIVDEGEWCEEREDADAENELVRTPPSSQQASDDEHDDYNNNEEVAKTAGKGGAKKNAKKSGAKKTATTGKKGKAGAGEEMDASMINTMVKTRNKLVGDMQNNDLYGSDDDKDYQAYSDQEMLEIEPNEQLDLGIETRENAPKKQLNFMNKGGPVNAADLNAKIMSLGFSRETNVNELAARGVKLSFRDELIRKLQEDEKIRTEKIAAE